MRIAVAASPEAAIPTLEWLLQSPHALVRVFSQPDRAAGRGRVMTPTPVSQWAQNHEIELVRPADSAELGEHLADIDLVITIGYGVLLPVEVLASVPCGFINLHFSILPRWRGAAPVQRAIEAGDALSGVTVFKLDRGMDTGPIYCIHRFAIDDDLTSDDLLTELASLGVVAIEDALTKITEGFLPIPQTNEGATKASKLSREEGVILWNAPAESVSAKIRAFTSNPGAWTTIRGAVHKIASPAITDVVLRPGEIQVREKMVLIGTATTALEIGFITPSGKSVMSAISWANGARLIGEEFCEY
jgi:methionyl-tRNA formyltransferase